MKKIIPSAVVILLAAMFLVAPVLIGADQEADTAPPTESLAGKTALPSQNTIKEKGAKDDGARTVSGKDTSVPGAPVLKGKVVKLKSTAKMKDKTPKKEKEKEQLKDKNKVPAGTKDDGQKKRPDKTDEAADTSIKKADKKEDTLKKEQVPLDSGAQSKTETDTPDKGMPKKATVPEIEVTPSKEESSSQKVEREPHSAVINPEDLPAGIKWGGINTAQEIALWAKHRGMTMEKDGAPFKDGVAGFVYKYGTSFSVKNLQWDRKYSLFFDFVRFSFYNEKKYPTELKIYAKNKNFGEECIGFLAYSKVKSLPGMYKVSIPYKYTVQGEVEIVLRELSPIKGFWGIWDMIITDAPEVTPSLFWMDTPGESGQDTMKEKDHIVDIP